MSHKTFYKNVYQHKSTGEQFLTGRNFPSRRAADAVARDTCPWYMRRVYCIKVTAR